MNGIDKTNRKKHKRRIKIIQTDRKINDLLKQVNQEYVEQEQLNSQTETIKFKAGILKFASLYTTKRLWVRYLIILILSMTTSVISLFLVQNTGIYSPGVTGLSQGFSRLIQTVIIYLNPSLVTQAQISYNVLFWLLVILINVPLLIFSYLKLGKHFTLMTLLYLVATQVFGLLLSFIPNTDKIMIFGDNKITYPKVDNFFTPRILAHQISDIKLTPELITLSNEVNMTTDRPINDLYIKINEIKNFETKQQYLNMLYDSSKPLYYFHPLIDNRVQVLPWTDPDQASKIPSIFVYAIIYAIFDAILISLVYIVGGTSGGTDIISFWYSKKKSKPIGNILTYFNAFTLFIGIILGSFVPACLANKKFFNVEIFFSPNLVASTLVSIILGIIVNIYFPKNKSLKLEILSKNVDKIVNILHKHDFNNSITVTNSSNLISNKTNQSLEIISLYIEFPSIIQLIRQVDNECLIVIYPIVDIDGSMIVRRSHFN
ncbi:YitT family protein [Ureaplasma zalophigenitalium]|uniref:YitT family protein n=1 Tax=Ureaplasma zalophigenitalium TaxID=907723 RepID=A0ABT3BP85_9BACT|nr:YitT family protein [Ureaplasma zalophigenitalium]MCV3753927.1 YitT family protein [Ureaplasma zalophigenitalium]